MKRIAYFFVTIILILKIQVLTIGCANIIPPAGGPRDSIPPTLIEATPSDSSRNFKDKRISFTFDEYVEIQNIQENMIVSPTPLIFPSVESRLKTVSVKLRDTLEPNTTYTLNFGDAIKDYNESNVLKNFTYVFSTGPSLDSLELHGKVILAETGKRDTTLIVMLHKSIADSAIINERPRYIAKLDGTGNFSFRNLPPGTFALYALKDQGSRRYMGKSQLFAFADKPVTIEQIAAPVTLFAYAQQTAATPALPNISRTGKPVANTQENRLRFTTNVSNSPLDLFSHLVLTFDHPLRTIDSGKVHLGMDSSYTVVPDLKTELDSTRKKLQVSTKWQENKSYHLILDKDFAEDTSGRKLFKTDTVDFNTRKSTDYGTLSIRFRDLDLSKNPVLLFVQNDNVVKSFPLGSTIFSQQMFIPGEYELRILNDDNKNGKWDPGEFFGKHKQPEIVKPIERRLNIRANWQNEFEIAI